MILFVSIGVDLYGMDVVVVGVLNIVGWFMVLELLLGGCIVIVIYCFICDLVDYVLCVDLVVVVVGKLGLVKGEWIKEGVIVIDVGINCQVDGCLVGDVEYEVVV